MSKPDMFLRLRDATGKARPVLLVAMTDAQLAEAETILAAGEAWIPAGWVVTLARWIRDHRTAAERDADTHEQQRLR